MAWKQVIVSAAVIVAGAFTLSAPPLTKDTAAPSQVTERQTLDANMPQSQPNADIATAHTTPTETLSVAERMITAEEPEDQSPNAADYDLDVPYVEVNFGVSDLEGLLTTGSAKFAIPGYAPIELMLVKHKKQFGGDAISVRQADSVSTITRRGNQFFATLALPSGAYRVDDWGDKSRFFPHQILAQRSIRHEVDYRHVH